MWVSPFRHPWIKGYLRLPRAFRSLSRLSSALSAKASSLRSFLLDLSLHSVAAFLAFKLVSFGLLFDKTFLSCLGCLDQLIFDLSLYEVFKVLR